MEILIHLLLFAAGLFLLLKGASLFTEHASRTARSMGVSEIVIGLTLVAFTTSLPELAVSVMSVFRESSGLALGNIIGSNIANIALVLGLAAFFMKRIPTGRGEIKQAYIMILVTIVAVFFIIDGLNMIKGFVLVGGLLAYVYYVSRDREMKENVVEKIVGSGSLKKNAAFCIAGGAGVLLGAEFMVSSATAIAAMFSIPETLIGLTIVAVGTSLPEIATTLTAAFKKMEGIALGNIIGSNIFNLLMVLGISSVAGASVSDPMIINYSIPMMLLVSVMVVIFMRGQNDITRAEGTSLLLLYVIFIYLKFFVL